MTFSKPTIHDLLYHIVFDALLLRRIGGVCQELIRSSLSAGSCSCAPRARRLINALHFA
jgi:hypothetical protein